jgi:hypothetical protein
MKFTATSQLMPNHVAGVPLAAQSTVALASAPDGSPLLFSLNEDHQFAVTLPSPDSGTGWEKIDLGDQIAKVPDSRLRAPKVQAFAMSQDASGAIWLVIAASQGADQPSEVYISTGLSGASAAADWKNFAKHLLRRQIPGGLVVTQTAVAGIGGQFPLAVVVAHDAPVGRMHHLQLNPQPTADWQCLPLQFPANVQRCRGIAIGVNERYGPGVYALCDLVTLVNLSFTTLPSIVGGRQYSETVVMALPDGLDPVAITAVPNASGHTELYAGGQGVYRWPVSAQVRSNLPGSKVADATAFSGVSELVAAQDAASRHVSVWAQDKRDVLMQVNGQRTSPDTIEWERPLEVAPEVTALAAYRTAAGHGTSTVGLLFGSSDGTLSLTIQDPQTTLWQRQTVNLWSPSKVDILSTYTTRVLVTDDDGQPLRDTHVNIESSTDCAVLVNGAYYALRPSLPKPATTDASGVLTIMSETSDITVPTYTFTGHAEGAGVAATASVDPGASVKDKLRTVRTGSDLSDAKRCDGAPLFAKKPDTKTADAAATAVSQVMDLYSVLAAGGPAPVAGAAGHKPLFAVRYSEGRSVLLDEAEMADLAVAAQADSWLAAAGDVLRYLFSQTAKAFEYWIDEAQTFFVKIGNLVMGFLVDVAEKAIGVVNWVLQKTLGLTLDDIIAWLGFIFSWGDIRRNHKAIAKIAELGMEWTVTGLEQFKEDIRKGFNEARRGLNLDLDQPVLSDKTRDVPPDDPGQTQSAEGSWGSQQFSGNAARATVTSSELDEVTDKWNQLNDGQIRVIEDAYARIKDDLLANYEKYTFEQVIRKFLEIVADEVLDATESGVLTMLDAAAVTIVTAKSLLTARWDIPVLTYVYEQIICGGDGSKLTLLDLMALLAAIPATIGTKLITGHDLFSNPQRTAIGQAKTWGELINGLATAAPPAQPGPAPQAIAADPAMETVITLQFVAMIARGLSALLFGIRELSTEASNDDEYKDILTGAKIVADILTLGCAAGSMDLITRMYGMSDRRRIDCTILASSAIPVARDIFVLGYKWAHGKTRANEIADKTKVVETFGGVLVFAFAIASVSLQAREPAPPNMDENLWRSMLVVKAIQNLCSGAYYFFAWSSVSSLPADVRRKTAIVRLVILAVRWGANAARAVTQVVTYVGDDDGAV